MIELLGVGVPRRDGGWLLHRVCATLEADEVTVVLSARGDERHALLDAITGRRLPEEGRVWVSRVPLMRSSVSRVRALVADVDPATPLDNRRSLLWNVLAPASGPRGLGRLFRFPRSGLRRAALAALDAVGLRSRLDEPVAALSATDRIGLLVARALARRPRYLVVRDPDAWTDPDGVTALLLLLRRVARADRLGVVVGLGTADLEPVAADRVVMLGDGLLLFHGRPGASRGPAAAARIGTLVR